MRVEAPDAVEASGLSEEGTVRLLRNFLEVLSSELAIVADLRGE